jgi:hypothetical protein
MVMGGAGLVLRTTGLDSWPVHVGYVVDKAALRQVSLSVLLSPLSVSFHQRSTLIFIYMLLLPDGLKSEIWEPSIKQCCFRKLGASDGKHGHIFRPSGVTSAKY